MLDFDGKALASGNQLNWVTVSEHNNSLLSIEHVTNGIDFVLIHQSKGAGSIQTQQNYAFLHEDAPNGLNYYRLTQTDYDGTVRRLKIITINRAANDFEVVHIYPSPVVDVLRADFVNNGSANIKASIYNINGQQIYDADHDIQEGFNTFSLNIKNYPTGIYFLTLKNGEQLITQKFIKK